MPGDVSHILMRLQAYRLAQSAPFIWITRIASGLPRQLAAWRGLTIRQLTDRASLPTPQQMGYPVMMSGALRKTSGDTSILARVEDWTGSIPIVGISTITLRLTA